MNSLDRPLLIGLLALEQNLVSPGDLIAAFCQWREHPDTSLGRILADRGNLSRDRLHELEQLSSGRPDDAEASDTSAYAGAPTTTWQPNSTSVDGNLERTTTWSADVTGHSPTPPLAGNEMPRARFRPLKLHAQGGLGRVFLAEDLELDRHVALKEIRPDAAYDRTSRRRFVNEAQITGRLEHPGIVPVYGLGAYADGRPFYAMRFIEGETLNAAIKRLHANPNVDFAGLEFRQLLSRLIGVANAVAFAHSRDVIHRDLKPQNVMLGPFGETLVVDWGLAKPLLQPSVEASGSASPRSPGIDDSDAATAIGEIVGTPAYMSPEQMRGRIDQIGPASDVYGLGAILYVLLTGHAPARGVISDVIHNVSKGNIPAPRELQPHAPVALAAICHKAMSVEPTDRYRSALELGADLERWLADEPTSAHTERMSERTFRWGRKHRVLVSVFVSLLFFSSLALGIGNLFVRQQRDIARQERGNAIAANEKARESAAATRDVIDQFLIRIGDDRWSEIPGFETVRLEMGGLAVERYRGLLLQQPSDASLSADAAQAYRRCANLYRMVGKYEPAQKLYQEAIDRLHELTVAHPREPRYELRLCETQIDNALLNVRVNGPKAGEQSLVEALSLAQRLSERQPIALSMRTLEARVQMNLAEVVRVLGRHDEAQRLATTALTTLLPLAEARQNTTAIQLLALQSAMILAEAQSDAGRLPESAAVLDETAERARRYLAARPGDANLRFLVASIQLNQALLAAAQKASNETVQSALREAVAGLDQLVMDFPQTSSFRRRLAEALTDQAKYELDCGAHEAATTAATRAAKLLEQLDRDEGSPAIYQPLLASSHLVAAEICLSLGDIASGKLRLAEGQQRLARAREFNPDSPRLADVARRIAALDAALNQ